MKKKTRKKAGRNWRSRLPGPDEVSVYEAKERLRKNEMVPITVRLIIGLVNSKHARAVELESLCTRDDLEALQTMHARDSIMINYIRESGG